ncbi:hypothetical protein BDR22DRAFT_859787, partial [Usnea florida]
MAPGELFAAVQCWDSSDVHVHCPCCGKIHRHSFGKSYDNVRRVSHCYKGSYNFKYPFSQNPESTTYEVDKVNKCYLALGASPPKAKSDLLAGDFANLKLDTLSKWEDAEATIIIDDNDKLFRRLRQVFGVDPTFELKRIDHVLSRMVFGDVDYVQEYLDSSPKNRLFIHGVGKDGKTALLIAACEKYPTIVKLLLERGADPNFQSKDGRTPLMEAALWGRYENVEHLLGHGAKKYLMDEHSLKAIDLATPSDRNDEERYWRSGGEHQVYKEITYTANQARRMIVIILKDDPADQLPAAAEGRVEDHFFQKSSSRVTLFAPIIDYEISSPYKTIARLERGGRYPSIAAMSGWGHGQTVPLVSGKDWTSEVVRIANIIGHALVPDSKDHGNPGQFHACHAEKQLIAYFISKHVFLEPESRAPKRAFEYIDPYYCTDADLEEFIRWGEYEKGGTLHELAAIAPPTSLKQASILVSSPPCSDCQCFTRVVNAKLNLTITVENRCIDG